MLTDCLEKLEGMEQKRDSAEVGQRLKSWRKTMRYTQQFVADEIGVNRSTYANWEAGGVGIPEFALTELKSLGFDPESTSKVIYLATPLSELELLIDVLASPGTPERLKERAKEEIKRILGFAS